MDDERPGFARVRFRLEQDEDGWPPAESEGLWAVPLGGNAYRIDNTPWFARNVAAVALTIPPDADLAGIKRILRQGEADGSWAYEEGCISGEWASA
jgi:hypothetical protein